MSDNESEDRERRRHLGFELHVINNLIDTRRAETEKNLEPEPPTKMQTWIIRYLVHSQGRDIFQRDIEAALHTSRATISSTLKAMEKNGYIVRTPVEGDARLKRVSITRKAMDAEKATRQRIRKTEELMRQGMSNEEFEELFRLLEIVRRNLEGGKAKCAGPSAAEGQGKLSIRKESDPA